MERPTTPRPEQPLSLQSRRNQLILGATLLGGLLLFPALAQSGPKTTEERDLSAVLAAVDSGSLGGKAVESAVIDDDTRSLTLTIEGGTKVSASYPETFGSDLVDRLEESGVPFDTKEPKGPTLLSSLFGMLPFFAMIGLVLYFVYASKKGPAQGGTSSAKAFTTTNAEVPEAPGTRFTDIVGCDEALEELSEVVTFLHDGARFQAAGARMPRGFLLVGPPGTGKTLLARAVAGEAGVPFYTAAGSDFAEMFVGVGAARVRDLFSKAKKTGGIVFIDELDSVGRARHGAAGSGVSEERESTLNALLVEMDGFGKQDNVVVIAATNRPDVLDSALLRAGRFDRQVTVAAPDRRGRTRLLDLYAQDRRIADDVDFVTLARRTPGLTGADISNLVNQAAIEAARNNRVTLQQKDFDEALATVMMGRARKSAVVTDKDREVTAWHEAGHTVAAFLLPAANDPVQVTIVPRGQAGGVTWMAADDDSFLTKSSALAQLTVAMGGRAAEEILLDGDFTQGASGDLASATSLALRMVGMWGMSSLGLATVHPEMTGIAPSDKVLEEVDRLLGEALDNARRLIRDNADFMNAIVAELLEEETVHLDRLKAIHNEVVGVVAA